MKNSTSSKSKKSSIIRWNAILPLTVVFTVIALVTHFFFDTFLRKGIEWAGYKALGTELNINSVKTSFINGFITIDHLQLTDREKPEHNAIELAKINFDLNMDALLRLKFVIDDMTAEGIQFQSKRRYKGKVEPIKPVDPNEPSFTDILQQKALSKLENENKNNLVGDIATFLKSGDSQTAIKNIESLIASKKMAEDLNKKWATKKEEWDKKIKSLPKANDLESYKKRFEAIKYKDFKSPDELKNSIDQFNALKKDLDSTIDTIKTTKNDLNADVSSLQTDYKQLENQVKVDIDTIKTKFQIPKIDAAHFTKSLFMSYLTPYTQKLDNYKNLAKKYLPPKYADLLDGKKDRKTDDTIQPLPRDKGVTYEYPVQWGYPLFWIKNLAVSSKSNTNADYGDISGKIMNITSNQRQIKKPTTLTLNGDFKSKGIFGIKANGLFSNITPKPEVEFGMSVASYPLESLALIESTEAQVSIPQSKNSLNIDLKTKGFKDYAIQFENTFKDVNFKVTAKDSTVNQILGETLGPIHDFNLKASAVGPITSLDMNLSSNLGSQLEEAFKNLLKGKIEQVNKQIKDQIDHEIAKQKTELSAKVSTLTQGYVTDINSSEKAIEQLKSLANDRIETAKKDLENKAKAELQKQGQKAVDDLKKKFGF